MINPDGFLARMDHMVDVCVGRVHQKNGVRQDRGSSLIEGWMMNCIFLFFRLRYLRCHPVVYRNGKEVHDIKVGDLIGTRCSYY